MKHFLKSLLLAAVILGIAFLLGIVGINLDQDLWANRPEGAMGHGMPVYTMLFPMLWLSLVLWISIIRTVFKCIRRIIKKIKNRKREE